MFSLRKLLGKEDVFFDLLEAGAEEAKASVDLFSSYLDSLQVSGPPAHVEDVGHARRKEKRIRQHTIEALGRTFVTPIDREDIESLSVALYRIPKQVEKIVERISIYPGTIPGKGFRRQAELLSQAASEIVFMVKQLRHGSNLDKIREANERIQYAEGEADKVVLSLLKELYRGPAEAKELVILSDIHEKIERAVDRCRNAGNIVVQIALKHS